MIKYFVLSSFLVVTVFSSCNKTDQEKLNSNESNTHLAQNTDVILKDSVTIYNSLQKQLELKYSNYFGFLFETSGQELEWKLDPAINQNIFYVAEQYEPILGDKEDHLSGKQYFTFQALKPGKAKIKFTSSKTNESRIIDVTIQ